MNWKQFAIGFGTARAVDVFLPGLGGLITGGLRMAVDSVDQGARAMVGGGTGAAIGDASERFGFHQDDENGATWLDFQSQEEYDQALEFFPQNGVNVLGDGVTEDGLPSMAIDSADAELALECSSEFCESLADMGLGIGADMLGDVGGMII